jgi:hypothetical protein
MDGFLSRNNIAIPYTEFQHFTGVRLKGVFSIFLNGKIHPNLKFNTQPNMKNWHSSWAREIFLPERKNTVLISRLSYLIMEQIIERNLDRWWSSKHKRNSQRSDTSHLSKIISEDAFLTFLLGISTISNFFCKKLQQFSNQPN